MLNDKTISLRMLLTMICMGGAPALSADSATPISFTAAAGSLVMAQSSTSTSSGYFLTAEISGITPVEADSGSILHVMGTIDADVFKRAWLQIGAGQDPDTWKYVGQKRKFPIHDGVLGAVPVSEFSGNDVWQVVVNVEHKNGTRKTASYTVRLK